MFESDVFTVSVCHLNESVKVISRLIMSVITLDDDNTCNVQDIKT